MHCSEKVSVKKKKEGAEIEGGRGNLAHIVSLSLISKNYIFVRDN